MQSGQRLGATAEFSPKAYSPIIPKSSCGPEHFYSHSLSLLDDAMTVPNVFGLSGVLPSVSLLFPKAKPTTPAHPSFLVSLSVHFQSALIILMTLCACCCAGSE